MAFSVEYDDLKNYIKGFEKASRGEFESFLRGFVLEMGQRVIAKAKPRTPVDTGDLRRSWQIGNVVGSGNEIGVEILNGMEYATDVEYGHRIVAGGAEVGWYDGRFMLKISVEEVQAQMPLRFVKQFASWCEKMGIG